MKSSQCSTSTSCEPVFHLIQCWISACSLLQQQLAPLFARPEVCQHALLYLQALLSDIPRKNGWQIAEQARQARPYGMQRLLSHSVWDHDALRDHLRSFVVQTLSAPDLLPPAEDASSVFPVLVLDESAFPKRGRHSAAVAMQYCGVSGQVENCQVGVFLSFVAERGHALIDRDLYVPQEWCDDLPRAQAAHLPADLHFQTKPELATRLLQRAHDASVPARWVVADTVYGHSPHLRDWLQQHGYPFALAVPSIEVLTVQTSHGPLLADVATIAQQALRSRDWHQLSASMGTKSERCFDWARLPVLHAGVHDGRSWLLVRRPLNDPTQLAFILVWASPDTDLASMVQAYGARWHVEEDFHLGKALGLDQYEVRSFVGWYRHITLVLLAAALLVHTALRLTQNETDPAESAPALIGWTAAEVQHLLTHALFPAPSGIPFIQAWSLFRRFHQYGARDAHRRRRHASRTG
jgi:SRSO17 transposase